MRICSGERLHFQGLLFLIGQDAQSLSEAEQRAAMPPVPNALGTGLGIRGRRLVSLEEAIIILGCL